MTILKPLQLVNKDGKMIVGPEILKESFSNNSGRLKTQY
jgi:hypothetical protein